MPDHYVVMEQIYKTGNLISLQKFCVHDQEISVFMDPEVYPDIKKSWVGPILSQWIQFYICTAYFFRIVF